jgi:hypothetical protein
MRQRRVERSSNGGQASFPVFAGIAPAKDDIRAVYDATARTWRKFPVFAGQGNLVLLAGIFLQKAGSF